MRDAENAPMTQHGDSTETQKEGAASVSLGLLALHRQPDGLRAPYKASDRIFYGARLDNQDVQQADYQHCTFVDVSFLDTTLRDSRFLNCTFIRCYFRRAKLTSCRFTGCRFNDSQFPKVTLHNCNFEYSYFQSCQISFPEMEHSLPTPPNLREQLCRNLAIQSDHLGLSEDARRYRRIAISSREQHLWNGVVGESEWYQTHFTGWRKVRALGQLSLSKMNGFFWGYGDRGFNLLRNLLVAVLVLFPALFWLSGDFVHSDGRALGLMDYLYLSASSALPVSISVGAPSSVVCSGLMGYTFVIIEAAFGAFTLALFAAFIFRWSLRK